MPCSPREPNPTVTIMSDSAEAMERRILELKEALEPFAAYYRRIHSPQFGSDARIVVEVEGDIALTVGAFRSAQRAMVRKLKCEEKSDLRDVAERIKARSDDNG